MPTPIVSVLIATYRRREELRQAVESVLAQTVEDIEVIVVEDGSDTAADVVRGIDPRVRYVWQENGGASLARNNAAQHATGPWLAILDDDDLWAPEKLERQLAMAERSPELDMIHTDYLVLVDGLLRPGPRLVPRDRVPSGHVGCALFLNNFVVLSSVIIKRAAFDRVGGFSGRFWIVDDYDMWLRVSRQHQIGFVNEPLTIYRDHESMSSKVDRTAGECAEALTALAASDPRIWRDYGSQQVRNRLADAYWQAGYGHFLYDDYRNAGRLFFNAWRWKPWWLKPAVYGSVCMTGATGVRAIRAARQAVR